MTSNEGDSSFVDLNLFSNDSNAADVTEPLMSELFEDCEEVINDSEFLENKSVCNCSSSIYHNFPITLEHLENLQHIYKGQRNKNRKARLFYRKQDELIETFKDVNQFSDSFEYEQSVDSNVLYAAKLSFACNLVLFTAKVVATVMSGSMSILSSVVDSAVDLVSGVIVWCTNRAIRLTNIYNYPLGRNRLEPVAILLLSSIMGSASVLVVRESTEKIISGNISIDLSVVSISIVVFTVVVKFGLYLYCRSLKSPSTQVLALDHRNDVLSNTFALVFSAIGSYEWQYTDPIGAIVISIYIFINWWREGAKQIRSLVGHTAPSWFLQIITWICLQHSPHIIAVDTVKAASIGVNYLVEVHIVLPRHMSLDKAHDIGESLQLKIENVDRVERAFVHLDYECLHDPAKEHKPLHIFRSQTSKDNDATKTQLIEVKT